MNEDDIKNGCVLTTGINSRVIDNNEIIGHVGFYDFDEIDYNSMIDDIKNMPGINVLWVSSNNRYHFWNLSVKPKDKVFVAGIFLKADIEHLKIGYLRDGWVLRSEDKKNEKIGTYKEKPTIKCIWYNPSKYVQSKGHLDFIQANCNRSIYLPNIYEFKGNSLRFESYCTYTDELKEKLYKDVK